jgi:hypothetical protein
MTRSHPRNTRIGLEQLEERDVPATFTVTNNLDAGAGSLRQAILDANALPGADTITFDPGVFSTAQTITLTSGELLITDSVTIDGPGAGLLTISGNNASRVFDVANPSAAISVAISGLTIADGMTDADGGGLFIQGQTVTLDQVVVTGNQAPNFGFGGGIAIEDSTTLSVTDSTISDNTAGGFGGGIDGTFASGSVTLVGTTVSGNTATFLGAGISVGGATTLTVQNSTVAANTGGFSGGISLYDADTQLVLQDSTVVGNAAEFEDPLSAGGIGSVTPAPAGFITLENSVVAQNVGGIGEPLDLSVGDALAASSSLIGALPDGLTVTGAKNLTGTAAAPLDPLLGPLEPNGGPTLTFAPLAGSPLLDAGDNSLVPPGLATDQRGAGFPRILNGTVDIGAVEGLNLFPQAALSAAPVTSAGGTQYTFTVTYTAVSPALIDVSTLGTGNVVVTGPGGFTATPALVNVNPASNAGTVVATYAFTPPGGSWSAADNGTYRVALVGDQVTDTSGASALSGSLGTFQATVPITAIVTNLNDSGPGSLRQAVLDTNANPSAANIIDFQPGLTGTITLTSGELLITDSVTIDGPGAGLLTVSGNNASRVFDVDDGNSSVSQAVQIEGLTISGGRVSATGGGILNQENLTLTNATISGNVSSGGGGVYNYGTLTLTGVTVTANTSSGLGGGIENGTTGTLVMTGGAVSNNTGVNGGGIFNFGTLTMTGGAVSGNTASEGGGINSFKGTVTLTNVTVSGNTATQRTGGIINNGSQFASSTLNLINSTVSGNTGGGLFNFGTAQLTNSTVSGNTPGGIYASGGGIGNRGYLTVTGGSVSGNRASAYGGGINNSGTLTLTGATVSGNTVARPSGSFGSTHGGGIYNSGTATLTNATVSGNTATSNARPGSTYGAYGGGIFNRGNLTLTADTISGNTAGNSAASAGGGIFNNEFGVLTLTNATVSGNSASGNGGGIYNQGFTNLPGGRVTLNNTTVSGNAAQVGGGIFTRAAGRVTLDNTIVANSPRGGDVTNTGTVPITLLGVNLVEDGSITGPNVINANPLLGPLADNGGPTLTQALLPGSPAVDAGNNAAIPSGVTTDQRGLPRIVRGVVDIGAFEVQAPVVANFTVSGTEDTPLPLSRADFEAAFTGPDSGLNSVQIIDLPANGTLTLNGVAVATGAVIPAAELDSLVFEPAAEFFGTATFHYTASDGFGLAVNSATVTLVVAPVYPTVSAPGPQTAYENVGLAVPAITVGDADNGPLTVTLGVASGTLTVGSTGGLTVTGNGTGSVSLTGSKDALNAALAGLTYLGGLNFAGTDSLVVVVYDGTLTATASVPIQVKSAAQQAADLVASVNALEAAGAINQGQATALRASLNLNGTAGDIGKVEAFLAKVQQFEAAGILSPAEAAPLLQFGDILLLSVSTR